MADRTVTASSNGVGVVGLLGLLFIALKLIGVIHWSWVWVLAPFWIPLAIALGVLFIVGVIATIAWLVERK